MKIEGKIVFHFQFTLKIELKHQRKGSDEINLKKKIQFT